MLIREYVATVAQGSYRALGFQEIAPYYADPVAGTRFFALPLSSALAHHDR